LTSVSVVRAVRSGTTSGRSARAFELRLSTVSAVRRAAAQRNGGFVVTEAGLYLRLIDSCITELMAKGTSRTCNESQEEEEEVRETTGYEPLLRESTLYEQHKQVLRERGGQT